MASVETIAYLQAIVGADTADFRREMQDVRRELSTLTDGPLRSLQQLGRNLTYTITAPLTIMGTAATSEFSKFDAAIRNVNSIARMTEDQLAEVADRTLELGKNIRSGPVAAAESLYTVFSSGIVQTEKAFEVMEYSTLTAEAGLADLQITTEALTSVILGYSSASVDAERASNALTRMVQVGVGEMSEFANTMALSVPAAAALGIEIEDLFGHMAFLTQRGFSASRASTSLNAALSSLIKPTEAMKSAFAELGVTTGEDLIAKFGSLDKALLALIGTTDGTQEEINKLFNTIRGARAVNTFVNNVDALNQALGEFYDGIDTATIDAWEQQMMSLAAQFDLFKAALQAVAIIIGNDLAPIVTVIVTKLRNMLLAFTELEPQTRKLYLIFTAVAASIGPLIWVLSVLLGMLNPITGAIALFGITVATNFKGARDAILNFFDVIEPRLAVLKSMFNEAKEAFLGFGEVTRRVGRNQIIETSGTDFMTFTFNSGDTIWSKWLEQGGADFMAWEEFKGLFPDRMILAGEELTVRLDNPNIRTFGVERVVDEEVVSATLLERLSMAIAVVQAKMPELVTNLVGVLWRSFLHNLPQFAYIGGQIIGFIAKGLLNGAAILGTTIANIITGLASGEYNFDVVADAFKRGFSEGFGSIEASQALIKLQDTLSILSYEVSNFLDNFTPLLQGLGAISMVVMLAVGPFVQLYAAIQMAKRMAILFSIAMTPSIALIAGLTVAIGLLLYFLNNHSEGGLIGAFNEAVVSARQLSFILLFYLHKASSWLYTKFEALGTLIGQTIVVALNTTITASRNLSSKFLFMMGIFSLIGGVISGLVSGDWATFRSAVDDLWQGLQPLIDRLQEFRNMISRPFVAIEASGQQMGESGIGALGGLGELLKTNEEGELVLVKQFRDLGEGLGEQWQLLSDNMANFFGEDGVIAGMVDTAIAPFQNIIDGIVGLFEGMELGLGDVVAEMLEGAINGMLEVIENAINQALTRLNEIVTNMQGIPLVGRAIKAIFPDGLTTEIAVGRVDLTRGRAIGGPVSKGGLYSINENGQELFMPNTGGTIMPASMVARKYKESNGTVVNYNELHFHDATDVDSILFELRRRGILVG